MGNINSIELKGIVNFLLIWDNMMLFIFFSTLCVSTIYLRNQYMIKNFHATHEQKPGKIKLVAELVFYIFLANFFLFFKNEQVIPFSVMSLLRDALTSALNSKLSLISNLVKIVSDALYFVLFTGSFLAFMILMCGIFLATHHHDIQVIYPHTLYKGSTYKKQLFLGMFLTLLFGFYPITFIL